MSKLGCMLSYLLFDDSEALEEELNEMPLYKIMILKNSVMDYESYVKDLLSNESDNSEYKKTMLDDVNKFNSKLTELNKLETILNN